MRENCLQEFEKHWNCLEWNNQVSATHRLALFLRVHNAHLCAQGIPILPETRTCTEQVYV